MHTNDSACHEKQFHHKCFRCYVFNDFVINLQLGGMAICMGTPNNSIAEIDTGSVAMVSVKDMGQEMRIYMKTYLSVNLLKLHSI